MAVPKKYPTPLELAFVAKYMGDGPATAVEIGVTGDTPARAKKNQTVFAYRALKKPIVRKLIERKLERFAAAAGMKQGKDLAKSDFVDELLALARIPISQTGDRMNGQVAAYELAAKIAGHITNKIEVNDITKELRGKSPDELKFIAFFGRDPVNAEELHRFMHENNKPTVN
jgi:hypothetical protein